MLTSRNPATAKIIATFPELTPLEIDDKINQAHQAFLTWSKVSFEDRAVLFQKLAKLLIAEKERLAKIATLEMGKTITAAISEVEKCALGCNFYADHTEYFLNAELVQTEAQESYVEFDPLGIVLAVMPWNFPYWQVLRAATPILMAGNVLLLKHASSVPQCGIELENLFKKAGFPDGVFQNLLIGSRLVSGVIDHPAVKAVTLTGSAHAGSLVASQCGKLIKKTVLELGGSDPFIVLNDADLKLASQNAVIGRFQNNGQSCIAAKRFIVEEKVADQFISLFKQETEKLIVGDPLDPKTNLGPVINQSSLEELAKQVVESVELGAKIITGGKKLFDKGYFYAPTILSNVQKGMPIYEQETFGPVAAVITIKNEEEAVFVANDTDFGLGASLWTQNLDQAKKLIPQIKAGSVFVNSIVKSDPRLPFGGINKSGIGRELSFYGIKEFVNIKTVWIT